MRVALVPPSSPMNNSLNNLSRNSLSKSSGTVTSSVNNIADQAPPPAKTEKEKIYGSSLLCYQNVPPPSPTNSIVINSNGNGIIASNEKVTIEMIPLKKSMESLPATQGQIIGDTATLPTAVKKRSKLRHRFSDVGSWGRKKKERTAKYRSMNVESLEVLGDPVIEDEFFVSTSNNFIFNLIRARVE